MPGKSVLKNDGTNGVLQVFLFREAQPGRFVRWNPVDPLVFPPEGGEAPPAYGQADIAVPYPGINRTGCIFFQPGYLFQVDGMGAVNPDKTGIISRPGKA